jgi:alpha-beta hydrolase superfamily lysophospholipase
MQHQQGTFRTADGLELFYQVWRPKGGARAAMAGVHGVQDHSDRFLPIAQYLVPRGYALYTYDLRGHARSGGRRGHINRWDEYREDTGTFLRVVAGAESGLPLFLAGHSMGGAIALEYALRHPQGLAGVVAISPGLLFKLSPALEKAARVLSRVWPTLAMKPGLDLTAISRDPEAVKAHQTDPLRIEVGSARLGTEYWAALDWMMAHARDLQVPLLMFHGTADRLALPEGSRQFFEQAGFADKEFKWYEGGYHVPHWDTNRDEFLADLERWLERHMPR